MSFFLTSLAVLIAFLIIVIVNPNNIMFTIMIINKGIANKYTIAMPFMKQLSNPYNNY